MDMKKLEERIKKAHEDFEAGRCISVELGSDEFYEIFNKLPRPSKKPAPARKEEKQPG